MVKLKKKMSKKNDEEPQEKVSEMREGLEEKHPLNEEREQGATMYWRQERRRGDETQEVKGGDGKKRNQGEQEQIQVAQRESGRRREKSGRARESDEEQEQEEQEQEEQSGSEERVERLRREMNGWDALGRRRRPSRKQKRGRGMGRKSKERNLKQQVHLQ